MSSHSNVPVQPFSPDPERVLAFLRQWPAYRPTPLQSVEFGAGGELLIKDETGRMGLGSFKALGGPYAVARLAEDRWVEVTGKVIEATDPQDREIRSFASQLTFVCASAGNHGMAVAAGATRMGAKARVHLAETVPQSFADRLIARGAEVVRSGAVYEDSMAAACLDADRAGSILLADASWPGYVRPPSLVMEGYTVLAEELRQDFTERASWPTDLFVQAGVGGLAAALACMIRTTWPVQPRITVVEPDAAPCLLRSHQAGRPISVEGPVSVMGRLDCKEASHIALDVLQSAGVEYALVSDENAVEAQRELRRTHGVSTTPSGAAGFAALRNLVRGGSREEGMRALIVVTEGAS